MRSSDNRQRLKPCEKRKQPPTIRQAFGSTARAVGQGSIPWRGTKPPVPDHGTGDPAVVYAPIDAVQFQAWKAQMPSIAAPPRKGLTSRVRGALTSARAYRTVI